MNSKHSILVSQKPSEFMLYNPPPPVGYICLSPNFKIAMTKKPNWFHRKMIHLTFGWVWENNIMENVNERTNAVGGKVSSP